MQVKDYISLVDYVVICVIYCCSTSLWVVDCFYLVWCEIWGSINCAYFSTPLFIVSFQLFYLHRCWFVFILEVKERG
jgi:hypothetical protein